MDSSYGGTNVMASALVMAGGTMAAGSSNGGSATGSLSSSSTLANSTSVIVRSLTDTFFCYFIETKLFYLETKNVKLYRLYLFSD